MKHVKKFNEIYWAGYGQSNLIYHEIKIQIPQSAIDTMKEKGVANDKMSDCYLQYVEEQLGMTFNQESEYFDNWCEEDDNVTDYRDDIEDDEEDTY